MAKYKLIHDRPNCIGCGACAAVCPSFWKMGDDSKSILKGNNSNQRIIDDKAYSCNKRAADACPVKVIKIEKIK